MTVLSDTCAGQVSLGGQQNQSQSRFAPDEPALPTEPILMIGPVEGWTTAWHPAPEQTALQAGVVLEFKAMQALDHTFVGWNGAVEVSTSFYETSAVCPMFTEGSFVVDAVFRDSSGVDVVKSCSLDVMLAEPITVLPVTAWVDSVNLGPNPTNAETYAYYSSGESIADLAAFGPGSYATSVNRTVHFSAVIDPPGFAPLLEWRVDGEVKQLSGMLSQSFFGPPSEHTVSVGPPEVEQVAVIDVYAVTITSHISNVDIIPEGQPVTFTAVTVPAGYEAGIRWLASTAFGSSNPVQEVGPSFTVQFDDTWETLGEEPFQWLGVKGDNTVFNQDQKCPLPPIGPPPDCQDSSVTIIVLGGSLTVACDASSADIVDMINDAADAQFESLLAQQCEAKCHENDAECGTAACIVGGVDAESGIVNITGFIPGVCDTDTNMRVIGWIGEGENGKCECECETDCPIG